MSTEQPDPQPLPLLEGRRLVKHFPGVVALQGAHIACSPGRILALVGENGAGKTTLCNLLGGVLAPDGGEILLDGVRVAIHDPHHARRLGIGFVHQELSLLPQLTVGENIMLNREPTRFGLVRSNELHARAREVLAQITDEIDVDEMTYRLPLARLQMVEIAKAWSDQPKLLILDEPTSTLSSVETERLFGMLHRLRAGGTSVVFISHRLDEVFDIADDVMVMKDGQVVAVRPAWDLTHDEVISLMVGRAMTQAFPPRRSTPAGPPALELADVTIRGRVRDATLEVRSGEIVGLGGLDGQGQRDLVRAVFGLEPMERGQVAVGGQAVSVAAPSQAMAAGIAFLPDDRKAEGLVPAMSVAQNMVLSYLRAVTRFGIIDRGRERSLVERFTASLDIKASSIEQKVRTLSGGNQQKVVLAKWLLTDPRVLVLDEPTRGIDVETKVQIYGLLRQLADQGRAILLLSSDMLELIGCCDRIYVMYEGRIAGSIAGADATEERLMQLSSGLSAGTAA